MIVKYICIYRFVVIIIVIIIIIIIIIIIVIISWRISFTGLKQYIRVSRFRFLNFISYWNTLFYLSFFSD